MHDSVCSYTVHCNVSNNFFKNFVLKKQSRVWTRVERLGVISLSTRFVIDVVYQSVQIIYRVIHNCQNSKMRLFGDLRMFIQKNIFQNTFGIITKHLFQFTMQIIAEKRGLNYYTSKDNFYSIKIKLETLVIRAKIRLKAQF